MGWRNAYRYVDRRMGRIYLSMGNADWSAYKSLYIKFAEQVPAKLIIDVNGNGNNYAHEIESGNEILKR